MKKGIALFITLLLVVSFSFISLQLLQTNSFSSNVDKLKYFNLQTTLHEERIIQHFKNNGNLDEFTLNDERYELEVIKEDNTTHIYLSVKDEPISKYISFD